MKPRLRVTGRPAGRTRFALVLAWGAIACAPASRVAKAPDAPPQGAAEVQPKDTPRTQEHASAPPAAARSSVEACPADADWRGSAQRPTPDASWAPFARRFANATLSCLRALDAEQRVVETLARAPHTPRNVVLWLHEQRLSAQQAFARRRAYGKVLLEGGRVAVVRSGPGEPVVWQDWTREPARIAHALTAGESAPGGATAAPPLAALMRDRGEGEVLFVVVGPRAPEPLPNGLIPRETRLHAIEVVSGGAPSAPHAEWASKRAARQEAAPRPEARVRLGGLGSLLPTAQPRAVAAERLGEELTDALYLGPEAAAAAHETLVDTLWLLESAVVAHALTPQLDALRAPLSDHARRGGRLGAWVLQRGGRHRRVAFTSDPGRFADALARALAGPHDALDQQAWSRALAEAGQLPWREGAARRLVVVTSHDREGDSGDWIDWTLDASVGVELWFVTAPARF